jgi:ATP-binding cassette subfamily C (CFTR/MRP) protein 1
MRAPVSFYDVTPMGRVINRFSKDQDAIDNTLSESLRMFLMTLSASVGTLALVIYATPLFAVAIVPLLIVYYGIQQIYRRTSRELKRIDSVSRSPLYAHYGESMNGISTIRAYKKTEEFIDICAQRLDNTVAPNFVLLSSQRWLSFRLEVLGSIISFFAATFAVCDYLYLIIFRLWLDMMCRLP